MTGRKKATASWGFEAMRLGEALQVLTKTTDVMGELEEESVFYSPGRGEICINTSS